MKTVVISRPVDWNDVGMDPEYVRGLASRVAAELNQPGHDPLTGIYPGSVVMHCAACGVRCWVGPKGQESVKTSGALVGCTRCVIMQTTPQEMDNMQSLGNPDYARRPGEHQ